MTNRTPITGPCAWQGKDIKDSRRWIRNLSPEHIRELETVIKRYVISGSESVIARSLTSGCANEPCPEIALNGQIDLKAVTRQAARQFERKLILKCLEAHGWNRRTTARALSISYAALLYKLRDAGIPPRASGRAKRETSYEAKLPSADKQITRIRQQPDASI